ncbi:MAG: hypothetical protein HND56_01560 [Pseudomonadota bacterium]|nr:hypothetical protein [Pseudomonadota bacterium]QKK04450.1 MAG: hypothetical protein HND56_01560 [Pseudomonadota bacterium]
MTSMPQHYRAKDIRDELVNQMTAIHYGSRVRAEAAMKSVEITTARMSYEDAKNDNGTIFWNGLSECIWLLQNIRRLNGEAATVTLSKPIGHLVGRNGDMSAITKELKPFYDRINTARDHMAARIDKDRQNAAQNLKHRNLRNFLRR